MEKLAEMFPNVEIEHEWADEDIGHNCGRYRYQNGVRIEEWFPETEREAIDLGCELMGLEPLDYGLALNAAGTDYVNLEDAPTGDFDEDLFGQIVESITVVSKNALRFCLAGGLALTERI